MTRGDVEVIVPGILTVEDQPGDARARWPRPFLSDDLDRADLRPAWLADGKGAAELHTGAGVR